MNLSYGSTPNSFIFRTTPGRNIAFTPAGGNVGIGIETPTQKLTVKGEINITEDNDKMYYGTAGEQYSNGSCMIIKGPSSTLELC